MSGTLFPQRSPPPSASHLAANLRACLSVQRVALTQSKRPFAAILVAPDNSTILLTHFSISHAESSIARSAAIHYDHDYLWQCTLYST